MFLKSWKKNSLLASADIVHQSLDVRVLLDTLTPGPRVCVRGSFFLYISNYRLVFDALFDK